MLLSNKPFSIIDYRPQANNPIGTTLDGNTTQGGVNFSRAVQEKCYKGWTEIALRSMAESGIERIFNYSLSDKCVIDSFSNTNVVNLSTYREGQFEYLYGFSFTIRSGTESEALASANMRAKIMSDIVSTLCGKHMTAHLTSYRLVTTPNNINIIMERVTAIPSYELGISMDLKSGIFPSMLTNDTPINQRFHQASEGLEAMVKDLYEAAITHFFQALKGVSEKSAVIAKYEPLRDALSHNEQLKPNTVQKLNDNFGVGYFELTSNGAFHHNSIENRNRLKKEAEVLKSETLSYLASTLR